MAYNNDTYLHQEGDGNKDGEDEHPPETVQVQGPPAAPVHERDGDQRHQNHHRPDADGGVLGGGLAQPRGDEEVSGVVEHGVDA